MKISRHYDGGLHEEKKIVIKLENAKVGLSFWVKTKAKGEREREAGSRMMGMHEK